MKVLLVSSKCPRRKVNSINTIQAHLILKQRQMPVRTDADKTEDVAAILQNAEPPLHEPFPPGHRLPAKLANSLARIASLAEDLEQLANCRTARSGGLQLPQCRRVRQGAAHLGTFPLDQAHAVQERDFFLSPRFVFGFRIHFGSDWSLDFSRFKKGSIKRVVLFV